MILTSHTLTPNPSYNEACRIIDNSPDDFWLSGLDLIRRSHQIPIGRWERISEGGNVIFKLKDDKQENNLIIKLVPPNWKEQGIAEVEASRLLKDKLSLPIPKVLACGTLDNWQYVVMTQLSGISLANVWHELPEDNKLLIVQQVASFMRELHLMDINKDSQLSVDWQRYHQTLIDNCIERHTRKKLPSQLVEQIPNTLDQASDYFDDGDTFFIHMDLHPWNLMVDKVDGLYKICGVLDFGDAVIGKSRLLEINTPLLFLCQGNPVLVKALIDSYQLLKITNPKQLKANLMAIALLRPACDFNFVLQQVPQTGLRDNWRQIADQLFPFESFV